MTKPSTDHAEASPTKKFFKPASPPDAPKVTEEQEWAARQEDHARAACASRATSNDL